MAGIGPIFCISIFTIIFFLKKLANRQSKVNSWEYNLLALLSKFDNGWNCSKNGIFGRKT